MAVNIPENFTGTITFSKTTQPKQYESEKVEITVAISDGDDVGLSLDMIRSIAYNHLGVGTTFVPYGAYTDHPGEDLALEAAAPVEAPVEAPVAETKPKRKRRTQAEIKADKAREEASKAAAAMTESGGDAETTAAYEAAQDRSDDAMQAAANEKVDAETPAVEVNTKDAVPSIQEIADWAAKAAKASTAAEVMKLMSDRFGVARLGLIPEDKRAAAVNLLKVIATGDDDEITL